MMPLGPVSEKRYAPNFKTKIFYAEGGSKRLLKGFVTIYKTTRHHTSENHNYIFTSVKTLISFMVKYRNTEPIVTTNMVLAGKLEVEAASGK
jgi:hypothetical protein